MKRYFSILVIICMMISILPNTVFAEEYKYAETVIDKKIANKNMTWSSSSESYVEKDGKRGIVLGAPNYYINVMVDTKYWAMSEEAEPVAISVEYFDEGTGKFTVRYISETGGNFTSPEIVYMTGTNEWKTHTFYLDDFIMGPIHGSGTINFDVALWAQKMGGSGDDIAIHSVRIEQCFPQKPIRIGMGDYAGNIYGEKDNKVNLSLENITEIPIDTKTEYKIYDSNNTLLHSGEIKDTVNGNEIKKEDVGVDISGYKFGLYRMDVKTTSTVELNGEKREFIAEKSIDFSKAKTSEPTDEKNKAFNFCTHLGRYDDVNSIEVLGRSGAAKIRDEYEWAEVEKTKGQYTLSDDFRKRMELLEQAGMGYMHILTYGNPIHIKRSTYHKMNVPYTDEEIEAYSKYGEYMAKELSNASYFEVWNEHNIPNFNKEERDGAVYAKTLKKTYETLKAINPDIPVVGLAMAGVEDEWVREVFEAGGYEYMDAVSCHPYDWGGGFDHSKVMRMINRLKAIMKEYGEEKPIFLTEMGWYSTGGITNKDQAVYAIQMTTMMQAYDLADEIYWYDFQNDGENAEDAENNFGTVKSHYNENPLSAKESFIAICAMNKFMSGNIHHDKTLDIYDDLTTVVHTFKRENRDDLAVLWTTKENDTINVKLGCNTVDIYDYFGNKIETVSSKDGNYTFVLGDEPIYVMGKFTALEKTQSGSFTQFAPVASAVANDIITLEINDSNSGNYRVLTECDENNFTVLSGTQMTNGKAVIKLKASENATGEFPLNIKLYDDNACVYAAHNIIKIGKPVHIDVTTKQFSEDNTDRWQLVLDIKNLSNSVVYSGKCYLTAPENWKEETSAVIFKNLQPGESKQVYITLPKMMKKRVENVSGIIELENGYQDAFEYKVDFTSANYAKNKPVIDGKVSASEWKGSWACADRLENIDYETNRYTWAGPEEVSIKAANFMWDEENFYLAAIVEDDVFYQRSSALNMWQGDCIQFGMVDSSTNTINANQIEFTEIGIALLEQGPGVYRYSTTYDDLGLGVVENCELQVTRTGTETVYELKMPWSEIFKPGFTIDDSVLVKFSMMANDNDEGYRGGWVEYNTGIGRMKSALKFGKMTLLK